MGEQIEGLTSVFCEDDRVALLLEAPAEQEQIHPVVVGDQDTERPFVLRHRRNER